MLFLFFEQWRLVVQKVHIDYRYNQWEIFISLSIDESDII